MANPVPNQFGITPVQGEIDLSVNPNIIAMRVSSSQATALVAGQPVKIEDSAGPLPNVLALAANTDVTFGFVVRNLKDASASASAVVEVALANSVMYMTAGAAIARGAKLEVVYTTSKVITNAGVNPVVGFALDKASADGDLIRVIVLSSYSIAQTIADIAGLQAALDIGVKNVVVTATLAEINAGKTLIAGVTGKKIRVTNLTQRVAGNFAATTSVDVQSSNGTPVKVAVAAVAALTTGAVLLPSSANVTLGAGFGVDLGTSDGLVVANVGSAATTGTSIQYTISYVQA